jgi:hypothetical protein
MGQRQEKANVGRILRPTTASCRWWRIVFLPGEVRIWRILAVAAAIRDRPLPA